MCLKFLIALSQDQKGQGQPSFCVVDSKGSGSFLVMASFLTRFDREIKKKIRKLFCPETGYYEMK